MKKKICLFAANYLPNLGGIERYVYNLSKRLISMGHEVCVVTSNVFRLPSHEISEEGIEIYRLPCRNIMSGRYPILKRNREFKSLKKALEEKRFDLCVINARFYIHSVFAAKFASKQGIECVCVEHGSSHMTVGNKLLDAAGGVYEHFLTRILKKYCKRYFGVSKAACEWSGHFGIKSEGTLYNAVDLEGLLALAAEPVCDYRKELGIPDNATVITYTGRLVEEKGALQLAQAFKKADIENSYLLVAGDGAQMDEMGKLAKELPSIKLLGQIDFPHIVSLLKASDIFCLPTVYPEGLPTSVLEAAAMKNFIVSTTFGGAKELVLDESMGILLNGNDPDKLAVALKRAAADSEYRKNAAEKCFSLLSKNFVWERTAEKLLSLLENNLRKGK